MRLTIIKRIRQPAGQDLIGRLLERKPGRRLGMLNGRAADIKRHKWFEGMDWEALASRRVQPPRLPQDDSSKRIKELAVRARCSNCLIYGNSSRPCAMPLATALERRPCQTVCCVLPTGGRAEAETAAQGVARGAGGV